MVHVNYSCSWFSKDLSIIPPSMDDYCFGRLFLFVFSDSIMTGVCSTVWYSKVSLLNLWCFTCWSYVKVARGFTYCDLSLCSAAFFNSSPAPSSLGREPHWLSLSVLNSWSSVFDWVLLLLEACSLTCFSLASRGSLLHWGVSKTRSVWVLLLGEIGTALYGFSIVIWSGGMLPTFP